LKGFAMGERALRVQLAASCDEVQRKCSADSLQFNARLSEIESWR